MERFPENDGDGRPGKPVSFDEPHEWLAMLTSSDQQPSGQSSTNQQTPRMTPKKTVRPDPSTSGQYGVTVSPPQFANNEVQTSVGDGGSPESDAFQPTDDLEEENFVALVTVDVDNEGAVQLVDDGRSDLGGMMVSLSVELEPVDDDTPAVDGTTTRQETVTVSACSPRPAASDQRCRASVANQPNCTVKPTHSRTNSQKAGMFHE